MGKYTYAELDKLPTLVTGQAEDLKIDTPTHRVWLSRVEPGLVIEETRDPDASDGRGEWTPEEYRVPVTCEDPNEDDGDDQGDDVVIPVEVAPEFFSDPGAGQRRLLTLLAQSHPSARVEVLVPAPYTERTLMTPAMAQSMLDRYMPHSRPLKQAQVQQYVRMLSAPDPEGSGLLDEIAISASGHTIAGQHLLHAIVQAGVSVEVLVRRNHPGPARLTPDGADPIYMARVLEALNDRNDVAGARWYLSEAELSSTAHEDGKLRRVELWHLTDDAARAAGFRD